MLLDRPKMREGGYAYPGNDKDVLHPSSDEVGEGQNTVRPRTARFSDEPQIHYGTIVSGSSAIKSVSLRENLRRQFGALCVETEAAGLMNDFPCLVVRGICDYADGHTDNVWHRYAAATAAAFAKELLLYVTEAETSREIPASQFLDNLNEHFHRVEDHHHRVELHQQQLEAYSERREMNYKNDQQRDCHRNFKTSDYEALKNFNRKPVQNTGQWVLSHQLYQEWFQNANHPLLWISADPGCGKSVMARFLIDSYLEGPDPTSASDTNPAHTICYFFFKDIESQDSLAVALCAILHQLFSQQPQLIRHALLAYKKSGIKLQLEAHELWRILENAVSDPDARTVACVLDGLDECRDIDRRQLIKYICHSHISTSMSPSVRLKWLVTSRPYNDIVEIFDKIPSTFQSIRLRGEDESEQIRDEINLVIRERMKHLAKELHLSERRQTELTGELLAMEHRTYLWFYLAIESIKNALRYSLRPDDEPIPTLPASVEEAYELMLARITHIVQKKHARAILMVIVGARRPLTIPEMALALDMATLSQTPHSLSDLKIDALYLERNIRDWCGLFISVNQGRLYLIHQTAKEFLLSSDNELGSGKNNWKHYLRPVEVEREMARVCVLYLCLKDFDSVEQTFIQNIFDVNGIVINYSSKRGGDDSLELQSNIGSFFAFASEYWAQYVGPKENLADDATRLGIRKLYDDSSTRFRRWTANMLQKESNDWLPSFNRGMNSTQLAAFNGHSIVLQELLKDNPDQLDSPELHCNTPLILAAMNGRLLVVELLLDMGADVEAPGGECSTALCKASRGGHLQVVELLLRKGADINAHGKCSTTALYAASCHGHLAVVKLLLSCGADVNAEGGDEGTALCVASANGDIAVAELLLRNGADVNLQGKHYNAALCGASEHGHIAVVELLLRNEAIVNRQRKSYSIALYAASQEGHLAVVDLLLRNGADVNSRGKSYSTPLYVASEEGHVAVVKRLLKNGADVNARSGRYSTALRGASVNGHLGVVELLLGNGADMNTRGRRYGTALSGAAEEGHLAVVDLLLSHGADVNARGEGQNTALFGACIQAHLGIVELILNRGVDINALGGYYGTALDGTLVRIECHAQNREALRELKFKKAQAIAKLLLSRGAKRRKEIY